MILAAVLGDQESGAELSSRCGGSSPQLDTFAMAPAKALSWLAMDPEDPALHTSHQLMGELPGAAIDELIGGRRRRFGARHSRWSSSATWAAALARSAPHHGASDRIDGEYLMFAVGGIFTPELLPVMNRRQIEWSRRWTPGQRGLYPSFVEQTFDLSSAFDADSWRRLRAVRAAVDPGGMFIANHQIPVGEMKVPASPRRHRGGGPARVSSASRLSDRHDRARRQRASAAQEIHAAAN